MEIPLKLNRQMTRRTLLSAGAFSTTFGLQSAPRGKSGTAISSSTPSQIEGPFYRPNAPFRTNLQGDDPDGDILIVSGSVRSGSGRTPLKGAVLDV
jgi:hypothetical protein